MTYVRCGVQCWFIQCRGKARRDGSWVPVVIAPSASRSHQLAAIQPIGVLQPFPSPLPAAPPDFRRPLLGQQKPAEAGAIGLAAQAAHYQLPPMAMARAAARKRRQVQASGWALHQNGTSSSLRGVAPAGGEVQSLPQRPELGAAALKEAQLRIPAGVADLQSLAGMAWARRSARFRQRSISSQSSSRRSELTEKER